MTHLERCRACRAPVVMVPVVPTTPTSDQLRDIPLDPGYDPARSQVRPSHALNPDRTACHPITKDWPVADGEHPALTHFATCPARPRSKASTAMEGPRR